MEFSGLSLEFVSVNRIYSFRAETMVAGLPRAFRFAFLAKKKTIFDKVIKMIDDMCVCVYGVCVCARL